MKRIKIKKVKPRRPYFDHQPDGYLEGDLDYASNNLDAAVDLLDITLENQKEIYIEDEEISEYNDDYRLRLWHKFCEISGHTVWYHEHKKTKQRIYQITKGTVPLAKFGYAKLSYLLQQRGL